MLGDVIVAIEGNPSDPAGACNGFLTARMSENRSPSM